MLYIAVADPLPLFRHGAAAVLSAAGHQVETPDEVLSWSQSHQAVVVLLTLAGEADWELLPRLRTESPAAVIAVLQDLQPGGARAVHLGARSVLPRGANPVALLRTVEATADGQAVLPLEVLGALTGVAQPGLVVSAQRLAWLGRLAVGATVGQVAVEAGYSERAMFRVLKQLYRDMGVDNRMQAVLRAQELGWIPTSVRRA